MGVSGWRRSGVYMIRTLESVPEGLQFVKRATSICGGRSVFSYRTQEGFPIMLETAPASLPKAKASHHPEAYFLYGAVHAPGAGAIV
jgi:hypothetical protein